MTSSPADLATGRVVQVEQASVRTATVTIQALTVNRRQVTLSLFRQLIEEPVIDGDTGELRGRVWGRVNYHPDRCGHRRDEHVHVVWQLEDELRRAAARPPIPARTPEWAHSGQDWLCLAVADGWRPNRERPSYGSEDDAIRVNFADGLPPMVVYAASSHPMWSYIAALEGRWGDRSSPDQKRAELLEHCKQPDRATAQAAVIEELTAERDRRAASAESWATIQDSPQLFIGA